MLILFHNLYHFRIKQKINWNMSQELQKYELSLQFKNENFKS